ncbi:hypothetical protein EDB89DRAFT_1907415 [Lactarius sanguifluus]|nr:hypothetical protein EDB89DRAFT_1907415 [Lactarius sanguifluus]
MCPALPTYARGQTVHPAPHSPALLGVGDTSPAPHTPPCPHTQEDGWCIQPRPTHACKGRDGAHSSALLGVGDTSPIPRTTPRPTPPAHQPNPTHRALPRPACIHERRDGTPTPPHGPCQSSPPPPMHARGRSARPPPPHGLHQPSVYAPRCTGAPPGMQEGWQDGAQPGGGAAHDRKDMHIGARVRKGECDGEGVMNEAKRSQGEAARANGGHPTPVDRLRKIHVK